MSYLALKHLHMASVALSLGFFLLRGIGMLFDASWIAQRWARVSSQLVDTLLLGSAIALTITIGQYPFVDAWLTAKLLALVLYIVLGSLALKRAREKYLRAICLLLALLCASYIVSVAVYKYPLAPLLLLQ